MILAVNGKMTAGMTMVQFEVELELSGPSLMLTVSRFKYPNRVREQVVQQERQLQTKLNEMISDDTQLGWIDYVTNKDNAGNAPADILAGLDANKAPIPLDDGAQHDASEIREDPVAKEAKASPKKRAPRQVCTLVAAAKESPVAPNRNQVSMVNTSPIDNSNDSLEKVATPPMHAKRRSSPERSNSTPRLKSSPPKHIYRKVNKGSPPMLGKGAASAKRASTSPFSDASSSAKEEEWSDDGNAWNGCVCGVVHERGTRVFWIQCDTCQSWYNVGERCVEMSEKEAKNMQRWFCWACEVPPSDTVEKSNATGWFSQEDEKEGPRGKQKLAKKTTNDDGKIGRAHV